MVIIKKEHKNRSHVKQHYVPQSYLKNFANVKDTDVYWIYCFDKTKKEKNIYPSNIKIFPKKNILMRIIPKILKTV